MGNDLADVLATEGYAVLPLFDAAGVARLRALFDSLDVDPSQPRFVSSVHCDREQAAMVDRALRDELSGPIGTLIGDYTPFFATFISKGRDHGERIDLHQDWTYTDERVARVVTAWVPLVDVDATNGAMAVIPRSQEWSHNIRVSNAVDRDEPTVALQAEFDELAVQLTMSAGDVLLYDPALLHGSPPNRTDAVRTAAGVAFVPTGADLLHFQRDEDGVISGYRMPTDVFYMEGFLAGAAGREPVEPWAGPVETADFVPFVEHLRSPVASAPLPAATSARSTVRRVLSRWARSSGTS